jgi:hypothetical protein
MTDGALIAAVRDTCDGPHKASDECRYKTVALTRSTTRTPGSALVTLRTDSYYRTSAQEWLKEAGVEEAPVDIERVAAHLGVPVRSVAFPDFFTGAIVNEDGLPVILLNVLAGERPRRDALGHLLGHLLVIMSEPDAGYPRNDLEHREADIISSELVMPEYLIQAEAKRWFNDYRYLARLFGVTEKEMLDRMGELGLVRSREIRWDY